MIKKLTTSEAADRAGVSRFAIVKAIRSGALAAVREGRNTPNGRAYLIHPADLHCWIVERKRKRWKLTKEQAVAAALACGVWMDEDGGAVLPDGRRVGRDGSMC